MISVNPDNNKDKFLKILNKLKISENCVEEIILIKN